MNVVNLNNYVELNDAELEKVTGGIAPLVTYGISGIVGSLASVFGARWFNMQLTNVLQRIMDSSGKRPDRPSERPTGPTLDETRRQRPLTSPRVDPNSFVEAAVRSHLAAK